MFVLHPSLTPQIQHNTHLHIKTLQNTTSGVQSKSWPVCLVIFSCRSCCVTSVPLSPRTTPSLLPLSTDSTVRHRFHGHQCHHCRWECGGAWRCNLVDAVSAYWDIYSPRQWWRVKWRGWSDPSEKICLKRHFPMSRQRKTKPIKPRDYISAAFELCVLK